jgi:hypothetical protein
MRTKYDLSALGPDVVYVKAVAVESLPPEMREQAGDLEVIFAVHDAEGPQLALVADRRLAFSLARQHDKVPMTVH